MKLCCSLTILVSMGGVSTDHLFDTTLNIEL